MLATAEAGESVGAKWGDLRYFEDRNGGGHTSDYGSISSGASSTTTVSSDPSGRPSPNSTASSATGAAAAAASKLSKLRKESWRRIKWGFFSKRRTYKSGSNVPYDDVRPNEVCGSPTGASSSADWRAHPDGGFLNNFLSSYLYFIIRFHLFLFF